MSGRNWKFVQRVMARSSVLNVPVVEVEVVAGRGAPDAEGASGVGAPAGVGAGAGAAVPDATAPLPCSVEFVPICIPSEVVLDVDAMFGFCCFDSDEVQRSVIESADSLIIA